MIDRRFGVRTESALLFLRDFSDLEKAEERQREREKEEKRSRRSVTQPEAISAANANSMKNRAKRSLRELDGSVSSRFGSTRSQVTPQPRYQSVSTGGFRKSTTMR